jgi:hypothetical protein
MLFNPTVVLVIAGYGHAQVPDLPSPGAAALGKFDLNKVGASGITMTKRIKKKHHI